MATACSSPTKHGSDTEVAAMAPLKQRYSQLVAGFDVRPQTTLVVSVDLQNYTEADDAEIAAMKREALTRWRAVWVTAHPRQHATLHVRFIDFIGRNVATESTKV